MADANVKILDGLEKGEYFNYMGIFQNVIGDIGFVEEATCLGDMFHKLEKLNCPIPVDTNTYFPNIEMQRVALRLLGKSDVQHRVEGRTYSMFGPIENSSQWAMYKVQFRDSLEDVSQTYKDWPNMWNQLQDLQHLPPAPPHLNVDSIEKDTIEFQWKDNGDFPYYMLAMTRERVDVFGYKHRKEHYSIKEQGHELSDGVKEVSYNQALLGLYTSLLEKACSLKKAVNYNVHLKRRGEDIRMFSVDPAAILLEYRMFQGTKFGKGVFEEFIELVGCLLERNPTPASRAA